MMLHTTCLVIDSIKKDLCIFGLILLIKLYKTFNFYRDFFKDLFIMIFFENIYFEVSISFRLEELDKLTLAYDMKYFIIVMIHMLSSKIFQLFKYN